MTFSQSAYHSKTYRRFKEIDTGDYRTITRFFEEHERAIERLEFVEYFELRVYYTRALFEIGAYERHLQQVDFILESSIEHNIQFFQGEDLFCNTLFQKAASHFNLLNHKEAEHILCELIKINPYCPDARTFLQKTIYQQRPPLIRISRAVAIALFLLTTLLICIELLFIRTLFPDYTTGIEWLRTGIFFFGILVLGGGDLFLRWRIRHRVHKLLEKAKQKRRENR